MEFFKNLSCSAIFSRKFEFFFKKLARLLLNSLRRAEIAPQKNKKQDGRKQKFSAGFA